MKAIEGRMRAVAAWVFVAICAVGCGSNSAQRSPTTPTDAAQADKGQGSGSTPSPEAELKGSIVSVSGACPSVTLTIGTVRAVANSSTQFDAPCSSLATGRGVEIHGTRQSDGSIVATLVHVEDNVAPAPNNAPPQNEAEFTGQVTSKTGSCPSVQLMVGATRVVTSAATLFDRATCAQIGVGQTVEVTGTGQSDGSVLATRVHSEDAADDEQEHEAEITGTLSQLAGTCPALSFSAAGRRITTGASTEFKDTTCSALSNGDTVEVKGTGAADGSIVASRVERKRP